MIPCLHSGIAQHIKLLRLVATHIFMIFIQSKNMTAKSQNNQAWLSWNFSACVHYVVAKNIFGFTPNTTIQILVSINTNSINIWQLLIANLLSYGVTCHSLLSECVNNITFGHVGDEKRFGIQRSFVVSQIKTGPHWLGEVHLIINYARNCCLSRFVPAMRRNRGFQ